VQSLLRWYSDVHAYCTAADMQRWLEAGGFVSSGKPIKVDLASPEAARAVLARYMRWYCDGRPGDVGDKRGRKVKGISVVSAATQFLLNS
jgi:hypothetical protein